MAKYDELEEKETYICMDHEPSWIFKTKSADPECPLCKHGNYVSCYSGDRKPSRKGGNSNGKEKKEQTQMSILP